METVKTIRQGDLLFVPVSTAPNAHWSEDARREDGVIREGEATGHHHRLAVLEDAEVFRPSWGTPLVKVGPNGVSIIHEEHHTVTLQPNTTYAVHVAREFDYLRAATRYTRD